MIHIICLDLVIDLCKHFILYARLQNKFFFKNEILWAKVNIHCAILATSMLNFLNDRLISVLPRFKFVFTSSNIVRPLVKLRKTDCVHETDRTTNTNALFLSQISFITISLNQTKLKTHYGRLIWSLFGKKNY